MPIHPPPKSNRGVAVVLALVILVGLLLLGLPLLFSMTMARSGTASFKAQVSAHETQQSAEDLAVGLGQIATTANLGNPSRRYSILDEDLNDLCGPNTASYSAVLPNRFDINLDNAFHPNGLFSTSATLSSTVTKGGTRMGVTLEDEGGKLDVNDMNLQMWTTLVNGVGLGTELATKTATLANYRFIKQRFGKSATIANLDELLFEPIAGNTRTVIRSTPAPLLTANQLNLLRPFITAHGRGQGRERMLDIGSMVSLEQWIVLDLNYASAMSPIPATAVYINTSLGSRRALPPGITIPSNLLIFTWKHDPNTTVTAWWEDSSRVRNSPIYSFPSGCPERAGDHTACGFDAPVFNLLGPGSVLVFSKNTTDSRRIRLDSRWHFTPQSATVTKFNLDLSDSNNTCDWLLNSYGFSPTSPWAAAVETPHAVNLHHAPNLVCSILGSATISSVTDPTQLTDATFNLLGPLQLSLDSNGIETSRQFQTPIGLRSWGVYRAQNRSTAGDVLDRPLANRASSITFQSPPATSAFIQTLNHQGDWEFLRRRGQLGTFTSGPIATTRFKLNSDPSITDGSVWSLGNLVDGSAVPNPIDTWFASTKSHQLFSPNTLLANPSLLLSLRKPQSTKGELLTSTGNGGTPTPTTGSITDIAIDGVKFSSDLQYTTTTIIPEIPASANQEFLPEARGRQIAFWVKPRNAWDTNSATISLLNMSADLSQCHPEFGQTNGNPAHQNCWKLEFAYGFLIWTLGGPGIGHTSDLSRSDKAIDAPMDDLSTLYYNEESWGTSAHRLTPYHPCNTVQFFYYVGSLQANKWHHITAGVLHNRPGGQYIAVDGVVGRGSQQVTSPVQMGDHCIIPSVLLDTDLSAVPPRPATTGSVTYNQHLRPTGSLQFRLSPIHTAIFGPSANAQNILPTRGTILIGNESISYAGLNINTATEYYRGRRADTNVGSIDANQTYPVLESHPQDSLVVPSGYRFRSSNTLYKGKTTTLHGLCNGDPSNANGMQWRVWGRLSATAAHWTHHTTTISPKQIVLSTQDTTVGGDPILALDGSSTSAIVLDRTYNFIPPIPATQPLTRGIICVQAHNGYQHFWYFGAFDPDPLKPAFSKLHWVGSLAPFLIADPVPISFWENETNIDNLPKIWVISLETDPNRSIADFNLPGSQKMIQLEHPGNGRIEWIRFTDIFPDQTTTFFDKWDGQEHRFFINRSGWPRTDRGLSRTIFTGDYPGTANIAATNGSPNNDSAVFSPNAIVLPVQTTVSQAHLLCTGDVLTLLDPTGASSPLMSATQMAIRYAATDGYVINSITTPPAGVNQNVYDVTNQYFTFTDEAPPVFTGSGTRPIFLCNQGWSGYNLSPIPGSVSQTAQAIRGCMPLPSQSATATKLFSGTTSGCDAWFDSVLITDQKDSLVGSPNLSPQVVVVYTFDGSRWNEIPKIIPSDPPGFVIYVQNPPSMPFTRGLVQIGSEIVAVERDVYKYCRESTTPHDWDTFLPSRPSGPGMMRVIARGLMGSTKGTIEPIVTNTTIRSGPNFIIPPYAPVEYMENQLDLSYKNSITLPSTDLGKYPAIMTVWPDGSEVEMLAAPHTIVVPWLRGMYGTKIIDWSSNAHEVDWGQTVNRTGKGLRPLLIGWWPRWQSALPSSIPTEWNSSADKNLWWSAAIRCRSYLNASFPMRLDGMTSLTAKITLPLDTPGGIFGVQARVLGKGYEWSSDNGSLIPLNDTETIYTPANTLNPGVDGMECKLTWHYTQAPTNVFLDLMKTINVIPPGIKKLELETKAPCIRYEHSDAR